MLYSPSNKTASPPKIKDEHNTQNWSPRYAYSTLIILGSVATMVMYAETMLVPALPIIQKEFNAEYTWIAWILAIYLLVGAVSTPIFGKLGDIYGKKRMLLVAIGLYAAGATFAGFSWNLGSLLFFRAFQGFGMAMFPLAFGVARESFPREKMPMAQGIISSMFGVGSSLGLLIGAWITQNYGWRSTYHTIIPIGLVLLCLIYLKINESELKLKSKIDYWGALCLASGLVALLVAMTEGTNLGWLSPLIIILLIVAFILFALFVWIETKVADPFIDMNLLKKRNIWVTNIIIFIIGFTMFMVFQSLAAMVMSPPPVGFSSTVTEAGIIQLPSSIVQLCMAPLVGILIIKVGMKRPMIVGMVVLSLGYIYLYFNHSDRLNLMLGISIASIGMVFGSVGTINLILASTPREHTGIVTGMNSIFRTTGGVIGPVLAGIYMSTYVRKIAVDPVRHVFISIPDSLAYQYVFLTAAVAALLSAGVMFLTQDIHLGKEKKGSGSN